MTVDAAFVTQGTQWAGQHALALYCFILVLLVAGIPVIHRLRRPGGSTGAVTGIRPSLQTRVVQGASAFIVGAGIFASLASQISPKGLLARIDLVFTDAVRDSVPLPVVQVFTGITHLGDTTTLTALCLAIGVLLVAVRQRALAFGWVIAIAGNGLLNQTLKHAFGRLRPLHASGGLVEPGYSFPSGHSSGSVVAYGMLAYLACRLLPARWHVPALCAAVALGFSVGASRLFMRVHFASDVLAGMASGTAWLAICITGMELMRRPRP